ncbi:DNA ligase [Hydrogenovibrio kuenenii]|uniref:DNA ligase n=1 Tax=Hydrogenovibrio kuenenii TaxID=63658 RepID=UPI001FE1671C|nr:DNA ligase [Hydrogenovibrio kuenenii]
MKNNLLVLVCHIRRLCLLFVFMMAGNVLVTPAMAQVKPPKVLLLKVYQSNQDIIGWLMSEKLDGVRGVWDGHQLHFRSGRMIHAPKWFVEQLPPFAVDGELWTKRNDFSNISSIVRQKLPDERWHQITYNIFEVPNQRGGLEARLEVLRHYLQNHPSSVIRIIPQTRIDSMQQFKSRLDEVLALKGEGLVVRRGNVSYEVGRSADALKVKPFKDDECNVIGYKSGAGKYQGEVGSIHCRLKSGREFYIGSGLKDRDRESPPRIGEQITFKYQKLTANGLPRHPVFLRVRPSE